MNFGKLRLGCYCAAGVLLVCLAACLGCGTSLATVEGTVTFDGKPVESGSIVFEPADGAGPSAGGQIQNGKYKLAGEAGVMPGKKVVRITAIRSTGRQVDAASLSRGTVEQLYLCLRFSLAEQLATTSPLPLLLDDILVNSDPGRGPRMARTIGQVAERQQVFMFTCHPWVVNMLTNEIPAHVIDLPSSRASA